MDSFLQQLEKASGQTCFDGCETSEYPQWHREVERSIGEEEICYYTVYGDHRYWMYTWTIPGGIFSTLELCLFRESQFVETEGIFTDVHNDEIWKDSFLFVETPTEAIIKAFTNVITRLPECITVSVL